MRLEWPDMRATLKVKRSNLGPERANSRSAGAYKRSEELDSGSGCLYIVHVHELLEILFCLLQDFGSIAMVEF